MFPITKPEDLAIETLFIDLEDSPDCDIMSCFEKSNAFIKEGQEKGGCLVHCYGGVSRSATLVVAYLMKKYNIGVDEALQKVKDKRYCACPNAGFLSQLRLYETMKNTLDENNIDYKIFSLYHLGRQVSSENNFHAIEDYLFKFKEKQFEGDKFKCRQCRKCLFLQSNVIPHIKGQDLYWNNFAQQLISEQSQTICKNSLFIEFLPWMMEAHQSLSGKLFCPGCNSKIGHFCWKGQLCQCGATISPSFKVIESKLDKESHCVTNVHPLTLQHVT
ncbi:dual specificity protein phosphatase MPK-4 [Caerostris extrusa]|uniref:protein-tyrosine-phosphatase n=1 Tax=Caerostris extrusa TaxID=172846 RepID=A0AAV4RKG8_CAEEX|nr:dual specificity protein phosphatase MPK-4 [Caerostris extrusa]